MEAKHFSIYFHVCQQDTKEFNCLIQNVKKIPEGSTSWKRTRCQEDVNSSSIVCWRKGSISGCWFCELVPKCFVKKGCTWSAWEAKLCLWKELGTHAVISLVSKRPDSYLQFAFLSGISTKKNRKKHIPCWLGPVGLVCAPCSKAPVKAQTSHLIFRVTGEMSFAWRWWWTCAWHTPGQTVPQIPNMTWQVI